MDNQDIKPNITKLNEDSATDIHQGEDIDIENSASPRKNNKLPLKLFILLALLIIVAYASYAGHLIDKAGQLFNQITLTNLPTELPQSPKYFATVTVKNQGFIPATLLVKQGTQITFVSQDGKPHQLASDPHPTHTGLSGFFQAKPATSYTYTFTKTGTFTYHDETNPLKTHGTVIVQ